MNAQTHTAALRAAARVAFSVTLLGCGGLSNESIPNGSGTTPTDPSNDNAPQKSESSIIDNGNSKTPSKPPSKTPPPATTSTTAIKDAGTPPNPACDTVLASAFGDASWVDPDKLTADVKTCCVEELKSQYAKNDPDAGWIGMGELGPYGMQCCQATNWGSGVGDQHIQMACTPWGPPVPPSMANRDRLIARRGIRRVERDRALAA